MSGARAVRVAGICVWTLVGLVAVAVLVVVVFLTWLTPERLAAVISREASARLDADVSVGRVEYSLWSSFPRLCVDVDSVRIESRSLRGLPSQTRRRLPADADFLASAAGIRADIDLPGLVAGRVRLHAVDIDGLKVNLVAAGDSVANYRILPSSYRPARIPDISVDTLRLARTNGISWFSLPDSLDVRVSEVRLSLVRDTCSRRVRDGEAAYAARLGGRLRMCGDGTELLHDFPVGMEGGLAFSMRPMGLRLDSAAVSLGIVRGVVSAALRNLEDSPVADRLEAAIEQFRLREMVRQVPVLGALPLPEWLEGDISVGGRLRLVRPWRIEEELPPVVADVRIPAGALVCRVGDGSPLSVGYSDLLCRLVVDGSRPGGSCMEMAPVEVSGEGLVMTLEGRVDSLFTSPVAAMRLNVRGDLAAVAGKVPGMEHYSPHGTLRCSASVRLDIDSLMPETPVSSPMSGIHVAGSASLDGFCCRVPEEDMDISAGTVLAGFSGGAHGMTSVRLSMSGIKASRRDLEMTLGRLALSLSGSPEGGNPRRTFPRKTSAGGSAVDSRVLSYAPHTSEYIGLPRGGAVVRIMDRHDIRLRLQADGGSIAGRAYPVSATFGAIDLEADADSILVHSLEAASRQSSLAMTGKIWNLREFLGGPQGAPLCADLDLAIDTVNINQLARTYERGQILLTGHSPLSDPVTPSSADTLMMLVPRDLDARIHATARETVYTNLHLYNLSADIAVAGGVAEIGNLGISSDFGQGALSFVYDTSDADALSMDADVAVTDVDVVGFFRNFHKLLLMMPQMRNLEGTVSARLRGGIDIFPDMCVNMPSVEADISVAGTGLTVHQDPFIRRVTRMLLIRDGGDLHIQDMDVRASVHDNLLELYPFIFSFDRYRLRMLGLNNFNGDMYYHIGVEKSPLPFRFGINVLGEFHHPEIRFGGSGFNILKGEEVASRIATEGRFNIVYGLRLFLREFLRHAAQSDTSPESDYVYR